MQIKAIVSITLMQIDNWPNPLLIQDTYKIFNEIKKS